MKKAKKILIVGAEGFGREVLCCVLDAKPSIKPNYKENIEFLETPEFYNKTKEVNGVRVILLEHVNIEHHEVIIGIGDPIVRNNAVKKLPKETKYLNIIHPSAILSDFISIGEGCVITAGVIITTNIILGNHVILNLNSSIGHDCIIGDYVTMSPGVNISGNCNIGNHVYLGSSACVKQGVTICANVIIGMGAVVVKNISEPGVYVGTPAKKIK